MQGMKKAGVYIITTTVVGVVLLAGLAALGSASDDSQTRVQSVATVGFHPGDDHITVELRPEVGLTQVGSEIGCPFSVLSGMTYGNMVVAMTTTAPGCSLQTSAPVGPGQFSNYQGQKSADVYTSADYTTFAVAVQVCNTNNARCEVVLFRPRAQVDNEPA